MEKTLPSAGNINRRPAHKSASMLAVSVLTTALLTALPAHGQSQSPPPSSQVTAPAFDVVSIKPDKSGRGGMSMTGVTETFKGDNITVLDLIFNSYKLTSADLIFDLPGWARSAHFDVEAKIISPNKLQIDSLTDDQRREMLLAILKDRFHFQAHLETKTLPVYDLVVAKGGAKFTGDTGPDADTAAAMAKRGLTGANGGMVVYDGEITAGGMPVSSLVLSLTRAVGRTVIDRTNLTGTYNFELKWTPEHGAAASADNSQPDSGPSIFTALEEQLGLKLQSAKGPVQTLVVDHVETLTEN